MMTTREQLLLMEAEERESAFVAAFRKVLPEITESVVAAINAESQRKTEFYTRKEVCEKFRIRLNTINTWMKEGRIQFKRVGRRILFDKGYIDNADLQRYARR